jgi:C4-dicarboxylate-specific signal transduction histidine kinase
VFLSCREAEIIQVLLNLINNACDAVASLPDKWVKVEFQIVDAPAGFKHRKEIIISVIDSGAGIPKNIVDKLMQPFFTTKDPDKGTGLGLSISNNIIKNHGGRLEYNSKSPNTRFDITLPIVS